MQDPMFEQAPSAQTLALRYALRYRTALSGS